MAQDTNAQRFFFIELIVFWEGQINSTHLQNQFGISRQLATKLIATYMAAAPSNLSYDDSKKAFVAQDATFEKQRISGDVAQYLNWIQTGNFYQASIHPKLALNSLALALPPRQVSPQLMRELSRAIRTQQRIEVDYVSISKPDREGRILSPHSFVNTGLRWHLRAYCEKSREYRDFVLSRFRGTPDILGASQHTAAQDSAWNTLVQIIVKPNPELTPAQQEVIANDYQMHNGQLTLSTKACLVNYWLQEMQINLNAKTATPATQPLVVVNSESINAWLFDAEKINTCKQS